MNSFHIGQWLQSHIFPVFFSRTEHFTIPPDTNKDNNLDVEGLLAQFGKREYLPINSNWLPLHSDWIRLLETYESVSFFRDYQAVDRHLIKQRHLGNDYYLVVGKSLMDDEAVVRQHSSDGKVYLINEDEGDPDAPESYASTFADYLNKEYALAQELLHQLRK